MKNKVLLSRLCICTLTVSLLAGCSSAGSTSETANNSETESISSETASETVSEMNLQRPLPLLLLKKRICLSSRTALMKPCSRRHPPDILLKNQM